MKKAIWAIVALLLIAVVAAVLFVRRNPIAIFKWANRRALLKAGLVKQDVQTAAGVQRVFEGGTGPTIFLLHGAGDQAGTWSQVAPALVGKYHVVIPDFPGHGESAPSSGPLSLGTVLAGLEGVMAAKSPDRAILVGNSMGAWMAMLYARKHPEKVERLVLVDGGALKFREDMNLTPVTREQARQLFDEILDPGSMHPPDYVLDDVVRQAQYGPLKRMMATVKEVPAYFLDGLLQEIPTPADLIWGESDKLVPLEYGKRMQAELPAARLTTIPRCGHVPQQECPISFTRVLLQALGSAPPSPATPAGQGTKK